MTGEKFKLYEDFAKYYEEIFPVNNGVLDLLISLSDKNHTVLDVGCASGGYASILSNCNKHIDAFDLSKEMIDEAKQKNKRDNLNYFISDMSDYLKKDYYNLIYCIGSTIAHLNSFNEVECFFKNMYDSLKENGHLLIKTLNYALMMERNIDTLPTLFNNDKTISFMRSFEFRRSKVYFNTTLTINNKVESNKHELLLLSEKKITSILSKLKISNYDIETNGFQLTLLITK